MTALALTATLVLLIGALGLAMVLGWRRSAGQPADQDVEICGPTCYPRVQRARRST